MLIQLFKHIQSVDKHLTLYGFFIDKEIAMNDT